MAEPQTQESLDTLQSMLNNVLVETGKALRAARKDGRGPNVPARDPPGRMSESIRTFHQALDSLEQDIVSAKSVLQRDLKQVREKSGQVATPRVDTVLPSVPPVQVSQTPAPQPVDAQTKSPMVIDLDSSPPANGSPTLIKSEADASEASTKVNGNNNRNGMTNGTVTHVPPPVPLTDSASAPRTQQEPAPAAVMEQDGAAAGMDTTSTAIHTSTNDGGNNELNFTNMTFAPPNEEAPMSTYPQDQSFDMSNFTTADGNPDVMALDNNSNNNNNNNNNNFIDNSGAQGTLNTANGAAPAQDSTGAADAGESGGGSLDDFDWSLGNEGTGDGLDFDFSIGGEDTFNTLMNERDGEFSMDQGGFDTDPFNMGKTDGT